ncbi:MAG TPA: hypothetical protein VMJ10_09710 [Kofleriaceae bacterium]|nr:hypothetical protein [Kofleriaceae bacterium]
MKRWLFSAPIDLAVFGGTAIVALALVALGPALGVHGRGDAPEWSWITGVLLVDVAHVWSTAFVVYLDPAELRRRPALYVGAPIVAFASGIALYALGEAAFWRAIAYVAVFHFIRQQYGWVMMYRARTGQRDVLGRWLDGATIYAATLYPLIWWHASLPRAFSWMRDGDFVPGLPACVIAPARTIYVALVGSYVVRACFERPVAWGKHVVVAATVACWYVGIVATNSDYAFTVSNVFVHGIPYMVLVYLYARAAARERESAHGLAARLVRRGVLVFLATLWLVAYLEELVWDHAAWHERAWLFGGSFDLDRGAVLLAPLLAVPQLTHYILDGFLWRRRSNPRLGRLL